MEEVLGICVLVPTTLDLVSVAVWFCCSILKCIVRTSRRLKNLRYNALFKENECLKSLANAETENFHLREITTPSVSTAKATI